MDFFICFFKENSVTTYEYIHGIKIYIEEVLL